jgi:Tol biopolymer transport system component
LINNFFTTLLNPFLAPAPSTPGPAVPIVWAVLGWVRRNLFDQAPTIAYNPTLTSQTGQTVTGNIGATDAEGDTLVYTVSGATPAGASTWKTPHGTLTIDQDTGNFTYTPDDISYSAAQVDSFTVTASDGRTNLMSLFGVPHSATQDIDIAVLNPQAERTIVNLPDGFTDAAIPRFSADGQSLLFSATPPGAAADARREIYNVNIDGTGLTCVTCGLVDPTPLPPGSTAPRDLYKPVPFEDGTGRILMQSRPSAGGNYTNVVYDPRDNTITRILTPAGKPGVIATDAQREMRISPDGTHVLFSQIQLVPNGADAPGLLTAVPVVGELEYDSAAKVYKISNARVVYPVGEGKQWTHDGKGVIVQGGLFDGGNVDDVVVDLATGNATRVTGNLDYDEDADLSPNGQWIAIDSGRNEDMLLPASRIERPALVPLLVQGSVYTLYAGMADSQNVTNQPWLIRVSDDLEGDDGIPLFVNNDGWVARSMPSWNADGTEVAFWEAKASDPTGETSRLVVSKLKYTTSVGTPEDKTTPVLSSSLPALTDNVPQQVKLPDPGIYRGVGGTSDTDNIAVLTQTTSASGHIVRTVTYTNYVNKDGMILNGTETTDQTVAQNTIHYATDIAVTGTHTGYMKGDVNINKITRTITPVTAPLNASSGTGTATDPGSMIRSQLDGETVPMVLNDPVRLAASRANV